MKPPTTTDERKNLQIRISRAAHRALKQAALDRETTVQALLAERVEKIAMEIANETRDDA